MSGPLQHVGHVWRVKPGMAEEYRRRHATVWPELDRMMRDAGIHTYVIYLWGEIVFSHIATEDRERMLAHGGDDPALVALAARWEEEFADILEYPNADPETGWPEELIEVWAL
jgi:L-rhamnose mutarotase